METIGNVVHVDDTSTAISYAGSWQPLTGSSRQWMETVHDTSSVDATATLNWRGTQVTVVGTIPIGTGSTVSSYQLDNGTPTTVTFACGPTAVFRQVLWDSGITRDGMHTLVIKNEGTTADFQLDEIDYVMSVNVPSTNSTTSRGSVSSTAISSSSSSGVPLPSSIPPASSSVGGNSANTSASSTSAGGSQSTTSPSNSIIDSSISIRPAGSSSITAETTTVVTIVATRNNIPVAAIVGGIIGGLVAIFTLLLVFLCWHRKQKDHSGSFNQKSTITPFDITDISLSRPPVPETAASPTSTETQPTSGGFLTNNARRGGQTEDKSLFGPRNREIQKGSGLFSSINRGRSSCTNQNANGSQSSSRPHISLFQTNSLVRSRSSCFPNNSQSPVASSPTLPFAQHDVDLSIPKLPPSPLTAPSPSLSLPIPSAEPVTIHTFAETSTHYSFESDSYLDPGDYESPPAYSGREMGSA